MGDAVNLAARLTGRARPGAILATADVLDRARTIYATEVEPLLVKGKEAAVMAHTLGEPTGRRRRASEPTETPIVGPRAPSSSGSSESLDRARAARAPGRRARRGAGRRQVAARRGSCGARALGFQQLEAAGEPYSKDEPYAAVRAPAPPARRRDPECAARRGRASS